MYNYPFHNKSQVTVTSMVDSMRDVWLLAVSPTLLNGCATCTSFSVLTLQPPNYSI